MGKVATVFKVYTADDADPEAVLRKISAEMKPTSVQMEEIGFGIKVIKVMFVHEDSDGSTEYEKKLMEFSGVKEVEVAEESLL
jgi:translation elongation factor EF-1beta